MTAALSVLRAARRLHCVATGNILSRSISSPYPAQLASSADSRRLLSAGMMHQVSVINVADGQVIQTLTGRVGNSISMARAVVHLPDPRGAVSAGYDGVIRVWRLPE